MKKIYQLFSLTVIVLGVLLWLTNYLSTGTVIINGNKGSAITLQAAGQTKPYTKTGLTSLSAAVKHGQYIATVERGSQISRKVIDFKRGHGNFRYSINLSGLEPTEPVTFQNADDVVADNDQLLYLDAGGASLRKIDSQNNLSTINSSQQFQTIKWSDASFGVGQGNDGRLYVIDKGLVSLLKVPFSYSGARVSFDVAPDKQIYVSYGVDVYSANQNESFTKIYTATTSELTLSAGINKVAVIGTADDVDDTKTKTLLAVVNTSGKIAEVSADNIPSSEFGALALSPNGQYLVSPNETGGNIYDSSLRQVSVVPTSSSMSGARWLDNNTFLYSANDELWKYSLNTRTAELVSTIPIGNYITGLAVSKDKSYAYLTTASNAGNNYVLRRVGLQGQQSQVSGQLQYALPLALNDCSLNLINFASPAAILVEPFTDSSLTPAAYLQEAKTGLSQDGFNLSSLRFEFVPGN